MVNLKDLLVNKRDGTFYLRPFQIFQSPSPSKSARSVLFISIFFLIIFEDFPSALEDSANLKKITPFYFELKFSIEKLR